MYSSNPDYLRGIYPHSHLDIHTMAYRYRHGQRGKELCRMACPHALAMDVDSKPCTFQELAQGSGISLNVIQRRYCQGKRGADLIPRFQNSQILTYRGHGYTINGLSHLSHINPFTLSERYHAGKRGDDLVRPPRHRFAYPQHVQVLGKEYTFSRLARHAQISVHLLQRRYRRGKRGTALVRPPHSYDHHNRRSITFHGRTTTFQQLSHAHHIKASIIEYRYRRGKREDDLVRPPRPKTIRANLKGHSYTLQQLSHRYGICLATLQHRYRVGDRGRALVRTVVASHH